MVRFLARFTNRSSAPCPTVIRPRRARLDLESLESRDVPAVSITVTHPTPTTTEMRIVSNSDSDTVVLTRLRNFRDEEGVLITSAVGYLINGQYGNWVYAPHDDANMRIAFHGNDGNDVFVNNTGIRCVAHGDWGNDRLYGGTALDYLYGEDDDDMLFGRNAPGAAAGDVMIGGNGRDYMLGSEGNDTMYGGFGSDTLVGMGGNDTLFGQRDKDYLYGSLGMDTLDGGDDGGADFMHGGPGADRFQMDGGPNPNLANYNRDLPADFNAAAGDIFYGADRQFRLVGGLTATLSRARR